MAQLRISNREDLEKWLQDQPREVAVAIAARAAMRALPALEKWLAKEEEQAVFGVLLLFRALAVSRIAALDSNPNSEMRQIIDRTIESILFHATSFSDYFHVENNILSTFGSLLTALDGVLVAHEAVDVLSHVSLLISDMAWQSTESDANIWAQRTDKSISDFVCEALWPDGMPEELRKRWDSMKKRLLAREGEHWEVWTNWYDARLDPSRHIPCYSPPIPELERKRVLLPEEIWKAGPARANAKIKRLVEEHGCGKTQKKPVLPILAETASPQPVLDEQGRLDVQPNARYDTPEVDDELLGLPLRQRSLIRSLLAELEKERNAPKSVKVSLQEYDSELAARGVRPFLGLLKDHAEIIRAAVEGSESDFGWCSEGAKAGFRRFLENHERIISHFPLDAERESIYADIQLKDELEPAIGLKSRLADFTRAVADAYEQAQLTTKDYITALNKIVELAGIISTMPATPPQQDGESVSMVKRFILQVTGFVERTRRLLENMSGAAKAIEKIVSAAQQLIDWIMMFLQ